MRIDGEPNSNRIDQLESGLQEIQRRLGRIEMRLGLAQPARPAPPPRFEFEPPRTAPVPPSAPEFSEPPSPPETALPSLDAELRFGSVVLPRVGAGIVLLAIAYLVGLSIARGWITPWHQFFGAIVLCLGFIGVGLAKRRESFEFGQVLIGIGSCGLYLAGAVGYAYHHLFSGEALIAQFLAISFLNLLYGATAPSRTFVGIGLLGGLAAAALPMQEPQIYVSLALNLAIALPAAAIVAWHRWREMALATWCVTMLGVGFPAFHLAGDWRYQAATIYVVSFAGLLAYARSHRGWSFDPSVAFLPFAAVATGFLGIARWHGPESLWHELALGAAIAMAGLAFSDRPVRRALLMGGLLIAFIWAPFGQEGAAPIWTYWALGLGAGLVSLRVGAAAAGFAGLGLGLGLMFYFVRIFGGHSLAIAEEVGMLSLATAVVSVLAYALGRRKEAAEPATMLGLLAAAPLVSRIAVLLLGQPGVEMSPTLATLLSLLGFSAAGAALGLRRKWPLLATFGWVALLVASFLYALHVASEPIGFAFDLTVLGLLAVVLLANGAAASESGAGESGYVLAAFLGWGLVSRIGNVILTQPAVGMSLNAALTLTWTLYALLLIGSGFGLDWKGLRLTSIAIFGATLAKVLAIDLAAVDQAVRVGLLLLLGGGMIGGGYAYIRRSKSIGDPPAGAAV